MSQFTTHNAESAPQGAKAILEGAQKNLGFIPNLYGNMAESPAVLTAYTTLATHFEKSSFTPTEQQVVLLTASVDNGCEFCVAAHSVIAKHMQKVDADVVNAIRDRRPITDAKLQSLAEFTSAVVKDRGFVNGRPVDDFLAAGFSKAQALEVILGVALKTLSNYTNHLTETETNEQFAGEAWSRN